MITKFTIKTHFNTIICIFIFTLHENDNQAFWLGYSDRRLHNAIPSFIEGIVSNASRSTPASIKLSILGLCHSFNSLIIRFFLLN